MHFFAVALAMLLVSATPEPGIVDTASLKHIANISYAGESTKLSSLASIFSPRMDFDQWKPLTGRGDPLRNDPTYDYEPPVLERVHYWADDTRLEREHYPERKSEVLMLGVSSRKPSVPPRLSPPPPRRHLRPLPPKYEDYSYKISDHYPMTILVPPPPPPPGHKPPLYILTEEILPLQNSQAKFTEATKPIKETTVKPDQATSLYALQEANLIYQSSTTTQNWIRDYNHTQSLPSSAISSDYAGWGPTTPLDDSDYVNDTHNFISNENIDYSNHPYSFYKPMLSEAPPPPKVTANPLLLPTFVPTALPPLSPALFSTTTRVYKKTTKSPELATTEIPTYFTNYNEELTTVKNFVNILKATTDSHQSSGTEQNLFDMLNPMISMPLVNGPDRPEDNLYAHASENLHIYKDSNESDDKLKLETMQTMQPPPVTPTESTIIASHSQPFHEPSHMRDNLLHKKPSKNTPDPYLHMRFTTHKPTVVIPIKSQGELRSTTETPAMPMYLIIQGHSKVKTYGSKPKITDDTLTNEIPKPNEPHEIKHLHPIKEKHQKSDKKDTSRKGRAQDLKSLVEEGRGSIEIQETNLGIKYDVSDGSEVPIEIYRKGIVDNDENNYSSIKKKIYNTRIKRQSDLADLIPFDEDTIEEYVYNFLKERKNETGITGLIAQAVTGNAAGPILDDLDDEEEDDDNNDEDDSDEDR